MEEDEFLRPSRIIFLLFLFLIIFWHLNWININKYYFSIFLIFKEKQYLRLFSSLLLIGEPNLENFIYLLIFFFNIKSIDDKFYSFIPGTFIILIFYILIGVIISGFIDPYPYLGIRILISIFYLSCKLFSNSDLFFNTSFIPFKISWLPIIQLFYSLFFLDNSNSFSNFFLFFWIHIYYYLRFLVNFYINFSFFDAPNFIENLFSFFI